VDLVALEGWIAQDLAEDVLHDIGATGDGEPLGVVAQHLAQLRFRGGLRRAAGLAGDPLAAGVEPEGGGGDPPATVVLEHQRLPRPGRRSGECTRSPPRVSAQQLTRGAGAARPAVASLPL